MTRQMKLTEAKARLSEVVDDVHRTHEEVEINRNGQAVAVIISVEQLASIRETVEILSDPELLAELAEAQADVDAGRLHSGESVRREMEARIAAERLRPRRVG